MRVSEEKSSRSFMIKLSQFLKVLITKSEWPILFRYVIALQCGSGPVSWHWRFLLWNSKEFQVCKLYNLIEKSVKKIVCTLIY